MKHATGITLSVGVAVFCLLAPQHARAQACKDEEAMVGEYKKSLAELVGTVKKESLADFAKAFHQKSTLTKLTFYNTMVDGLLGCLDKAAQDATALKEEVEAAKAKRANYAKLKEKIQHDRGALKDAEAAKDAKALIEKFDVAG